MSVAVPGKMRGEVGAVLAAAALAGGCLTNEQELGGAGQRAQVCGTLDTAPAAAGQECGRFFLEGPTQGQGRMELELSGDVSTGLGSGRVGNAKVQGMARISGDPAGLFLEITGIAMAPIHAGPMAPGPDGRYGADLVFQFDFGRMNRTDKRVEPTGNVRSARATIAFHLLPDASDPTGVDGDVVSLTASNVRVDPGALSPVLNAELRLSGKMRIVRGRGTSTWCSCTVDLATQCGCLSAQTVQAIEGDLRAAGCALSRPLAVPACPSQQQACAAGADGRWAGVACVDEGWTDEAASDPYEQPYEEPYEEPYQPPEEPYQPAAEDECSAGGGWCWCDDGYEGYEDCCDYCPW